MNCSRLTKALLAQNVGIKSFFPGGLKGKSTIGNARMVTTITVSTSAGHVVAVLTHGMKRRLIVENDDGL